MMTKMEERALRDNVVWVENPPPIESREKL
jgi:hypothetical protein